MENHDSRLKAQACFGFLWMTARYLHELWLWKSKLWGSWIFWFEETYADMDHVKQRVLQSGTGEVSLGSEKCWTFSCVCVYMQVCVYVSLAPAFFHKREHRLFWTCSGFLFLPEMTSYHCIKTPFIHSFFYWSGLPFSCVRDLADPGIKPRTPSWQADSLQSEPPEQRSPLQMLKCHNM